MKRLPIILLMCLSAQSANEVRAVIDGSPTAYYVVREVDGDVWATVGQVFEVFGTGGRDMTDYDIALVDKTGGFYVGTFDTNIAAGQYYLIAHQQAGGSPADADPPVWQELGDWDGTSAWAPGGKSVWEELVTDHTDELTFGGEVGGLDPNLTLVKYVTDRLFVLDTTIDDPNDANNFTITGGLDVNDVYDWHLIRVTDADDGHAEVRWIEDYQVGRDIFVDEAFGFVPDIGDEVQIMSTGYGGWLWEMLTSLKQSKIGIYYFNVRGTGLGGSPREITQRSQGR